MMTSADESPGRIVEPAGPSTATTLKPYALPLAGPHLVEASAGTGKTYTIGTLILRLLLEAPTDGREPPRIGEILVVTFTVAATGELRQRVRERLRDALARVDGGPGDARDPTFTRWLDDLAARDRSSCRTRLRQALREFDDAAIATIHGFCQRTLREHAFESGVDFGAELVGDESTLRRTAIQDYWARMTYDAPALAVAWLAGPGKLDLPAMIHLGEAMAGAPRIERQPPRPDGATAGDGELDRLAGELAATWSAAAEAWRAGGPAALERLAAAAEGGQLNGQTYKADRIRGPWRAELASLFAQPPNWPGDDQRKRLASLSAGRMRVKQHGMAPEHPFFDACARLLTALEAADEELTTWGLALRHGLDQWLAEELPARKRRARQMSFDDLLVRLHDALHQDEETARRLAARLRGRYRAALIDEFQDTDQVQYEIFQRVFAPPGSALGPDAPPLFLVGDPKQAIYAFRGADVFAYLAAVAAVGEDRQYTLTKNFRSDDGLVRALEALWAPPVPRPFLIGRIQFTPVRAHHPDRIESDGPPLTLAYLPAPVGRLGTPGTVVNAPLARRAVARAAAGAIQALLDRPPQVTVDGKAPRPAKASDVAVLVRANAQARLMQRVLAARGIPSVLHSEASVLDQPEAEELRQLLGALADPADAGQVRAALVTPALGLDGAALDGLATDEAAWEGWVEAFRRWQEAWRRHGFLPALRQLLDERGTPARLLTLADGERRLTNLLHLVELLHGVAFELELGPEGLLAWFDRVRADPDLRQRVLGDTAQLRLERDEDAVTIATIHRAKGLEYGFVFCPFLWSGAHPVGAPPLRYHDLDGAGRQRLAIDRDLDEGAKAIAQSEGLAEDLRLLYVAMTRARHALWLACGPFRDSHSGALAYLLQARAAAIAPPEGDGSADLANWRAALAAAAKADLSAAAEATGAGDDPLWATVLALAERHPRLIHARRLGPADLRPAEDAPTSPPSARELAARPAPRPPAQVLRRSSFTALTSGRRAEAEGAGPAGQDHDAEPPREAAELPTAEEAPEAERVPLADLVAGTRLGTGLHALLEHIDYAHADGGHWAERAAALVRSRALPAEAAPPLLEALPRILGTPLGTGELAFSLDQLKWPDRINEMEYLLPVAVRAQGARFLPEGRPTDRGKGRAGPAVGPRELAAVLRSHPGGALPADYPDRLAALGADAVAGWFVGTLDLVFRRPQAGGERWYLLDWKSNRLGRTWADYAPERLATAMAQHHYFLQAHLYALALHRFLRQRVAGYDYERHFGGALYLFVRGMRPDVPGSGVYFGRPPAGRIEALDALLGGGAP